MRQSRVEGRGTRVSTHGNEKRRPCVAANDSGCYAFAVMYCQKRSASPSPSQTSYRGKHETVHQLQACRGEETGEAEVERHINKLGKLLQSYSPDLVHCTEHLRRTRGRTRGLGTLEFVVADGNAACHGDRRKLCGRALQRAFGEL